MLRQVGLLLDLIRFNHTVFALPFALTSAALAWRVRWGEGSFSLQSFTLELVGILLCMVFARSAAMAFNRLVDRKLDAANPRTAMRHLPAGLISPRSVLLFAFGPATFFLYLARWRRLRRRRGPDCAPAFIHPRTGHTFREHERH